MMTVTFCTYVSTSSLCVFFNKTINNLDFTPSKMDVFYNEFSAPKFFVKYNPKLLQLLSQSEVDGRITSFSLYDSKYSNENVTPFFRAKILDTTCSNKQVLCIVEWVSYPRLYFNPDIHFLSDYLCDKVKMVFLFAYNQFDAERRTGKTNYFKYLLNPQSRWGKKVMVGNMPFIAAPIMFFGKAYFDTIPKEDLIKVPNSQEIRINEQEVISIKLFDLYENPNLNRDFQKKYWKITSLSQRINKYKEKVSSVDAIMRYKARYEKMKAQKHKERNESF